MPKQANKVVSAMGIIVLAASLLLRMPSKTRFHPTEAIEHTKQSLEAIERRHGGRVGVALLDTGDGSSIEHRGAERFAMASTFKLLLVAAVLSKVDAGVLQLDQKISYTAEEILEYAPITTSHLSEGAMSVEALCAAAIEFSDNTAANVLLRVLGGPAQLTSFLRSSGDSVSRLDRIEPELNSNLKDDERDTTTPRAMVATVRSLLFGDVLKAESRQRLERFLTANTTGAKRIRAGVPTEWLVGDKTGTGENGATNDVAVLRPPSRAPLILAVYYSESTAPLQEREAVVAAATAVVTGGQLPMPLE